MPSCPFAVAVMGISLVNFSRFAPGPLAGASIFSTVPETPNSVLSTSAFRPLHSSIMSEGWSNTSRGGFWFTAKSKLLNATALFTLTNSKLFISSVEGTMRSSRVSSKPTFLSITEASLANARNSLSGSTAARRPDRPNDTSRMAATNASSSERSRRTVL